MNFYRLVARGGTGLSCDEKGVAIGPFPLVTRDRRAKPTYRVRPRKDIARALRAGWHGMIPEIIDHVAEGLSRIAQALNDGDHVRARIMAVQLRVPGLSAEALPKLAKAAGLKKYNPNVEQEARVPAGEDGGEWTGGPSTTPPLYHNDNDNTDKPHVKPPSVWDNFRSALTATTLTDKRQRIYGEIFSAEGGHAKDPHSGAVAGLDQATVNAAITATYLPGAKSGTKPESLSDKQIIQAYNYYFDTALSRVDPATSHTIGASTLLETIDDTQTAAAFADTTFRHGSGAGAKIVRDALNDVIAHMPADERERAGVTGQIESNSNKLDASTFDRFRDLANNGYATQLRNALADKRNGEKPGEQWRNNHFR